jgi:hypothetical protein
MAVILTAWPPGYRLDPARASHRHPDRAEPGYTPDMCIICVELAKQSMTPSEARRALREMTVKLDQAHVAEVETKLRQAEAADPTKP